MDVPVVLGVCVKVPVVLGVCVPVSLLLAVCDCDPDCEDVRLVVAVLVPDRVPVVVPVVLGVCVELPV